MRQIKVPKQIEKELRILGMKVVPFWIVTALVTVNILILFFSFSALTVLWCLLGSTAEFMLVNYLYEQPWMSNLFNQSLPKEIINDL